MKERINYPPDAPVPPMGHSMYPQAQSKQCVVRYNTDTTNPEVPFCYTYKSKLNNDN